MGVVLHPPFVRLWKWIMEVVFCLFHVYKNVDIFSVFLFQSLEFIIILILWRYIFINTD